MLLRFRSLLFSLLCILGIARFAQAAEHFTAQLGAVGVASNQWTRVSGSVDGRPFDNFRLALFASDDLTAWKEIAVLHGRSFQFLDPASFGLGARYYRFAADVLSDTNSDWKNQIVDYADPFGFGYVKFIIRKDDPTRVYYSDSYKHLFHFDFVSTRLDGYMGLDGTRFQEITRYNDTRELYIGSVIFPGPRGEYAIQFDGSDPLPPAEVVQLFHLVESTVSHEATNTAPARAFYLPAYEQITPARQNEAYFETNAVPLATLDRWAYSDIAYSVGRTVGRLRYVASTNINAAYAFGGLLATDILLTDGIPAEIPFVAGIISLTPATPNSHVAILARSYGVPFVYFREESKRQELLGLTNREVALEAVETWGGYGNSVLLLSDDFPAELRVEMLKLTASGNIEITPKARFGNYTAPTDNLYPRDVRYFGGKAANFGTLRRTIPSNSPPAWTITAADSVCITPEQTCITSIGGARSCKVEPTGRIRAAFFRVARRMCIFSTI